MTIPFVDFARHTAAYNREIDAAIRSELQAAQFVLGQQLEVFEQEFAAYTGTSACIGVASGTDALFLSLLALGIGKGDEVIVPAMTFIASLLPVVYSGARPVLVDILPDIPLINPAAIEAAITQKTKAIIAVHLHGHPCDMNRMSAIAKRHRLFLIEDACQAVGSQVAVPQSFRLPKSPRLLREKTIWKKAGSIGTVGCFSFYPAKNLGAFGDGGAAVTSDTDLEKKIRMLRNYGQTEKYHHQIIGYNSRLDTLQAAVLRVKLRYLDEWNTQRRQHAASYTRSLRGVPVTVPKEQPDCKSNYHIYQIRTQMRDKLIQVFKDRQIGYGMHYPLPLHLQPALAKFGYPKRAFPYARAFAKTTLSLPMFPQLKKEEIDSIVETIRMCDTN